MHFGCHWGSIFELFGALLETNFAFIFGVRFLMIFYGFRPQFWHHFGIENRDRRHSGAKSSTFDFERQYNENQRFSVWGGARWLPKLLPGRLPKHSAFSMHFRCQKCHQHGSEMHQKLHRNVLKNTPRIFNKKVTKNVSKMRSKRSSKDSPGEARGHPKWSLGSPRAARGSWNITSQRK